MVLLKRVLSMKRPVITASIIIFLLCPNSFSLAQDAGVAKPSVEPERVVVKKDRQFPIGNGFGPPGCAYEESSIVCRTDSRPVSKFEIDIVEQKGWGTALEESHLGQGCVVLKIRLSVDNSGVGGRTCLEPAASLNLLITLYSDLDAKAKDIDPQSLK